MPRKPTGRPRGRPRHPDLLTPAEQRVYDLVCGGLTNAEIAERLAISTDGVKFHVSNVLGKLGASSREELLRTPGNRARNLGVGLAAAIGSVAVGVLAVAIGAALLGDGRSAEPPAQAHSIETIHLGVSGADADGYVGELTVSRDGRFAAFVSSGSNLVAGDTNDAADIFLRDMATGETTLVSRGRAGEPADGFSRAPAISADGRFVAFESGASNLVVGDTNGDRDRALAALPPEEAERFRAGEAGRDDVMLSLLAGTDVFVYDRVAGVVELVSLSSSGEPANLGSGAPSISADGRLIAFSSLATNLVEGDTNYGRGSSGMRIFWNVGGADVFLRDRSAGTTARVSLTSDGAQLEGTAVDPSLSSDGRYLAFLSDALNLADGSHALMRGYTRDLVTGEVAMLSVPHQGERPTQNLFYPPAWSADGAASVRSANDFWDRRSYVLLSATGDAEPEVLWEGDMDTWSAQEAISAISTDGRYVAFLEPVTNAVAESSPAGPAPKPTRITRVDRTTGARTGFDVPADAGVTALRVLDSGEVIFSSSSHDIGTRRTTGALHRLRFP